MMIDECDSRKRVRPYDPVVDDPSESEFEEWAAWFKCLADPTRLRILHFVANLDSPATVGDVVNALGLTQSNVSHHLKVLASERFVVLDADGTRTRVTANELCMVELPDAAAAIMGTRPPRD